MEKDYESARRNNPYKVKQFKYNDFHNLKQLAADSITNRRLSSSGENVQWLQVRWLRYQKQFPNKIFVKTDFDQEEFQILEQRNRARPNLVPRYTEPLAISKAKKDDLLMLCRTGVIPVTYHEFYRRLPFNDYVKDIAPQPVTAETDVELENEFEQEKRSMSRKRSSSTGLPGIENIPARPPVLNRDSERAFAKNKKPAAKRHSLRSIENTPTGPLAADENGAGEQRSTRQ